MRVVLLACLPESFPDASGPGASGRMETLGRNLDMVAALPEGRALAVLGDEKLAELAVSRGLEHVVAAFRRAPQPDDLLPAGCLEALELLSSRGMVAPGEPVLVLDGFALNLFAGTLLKAVRRHEGSDQALLLSVANCRDNPIQCDAYHSILALNVVSPLEGQASDGFPFDWAAYGYAHCAPGTLFHIPGEDSPAGPGEPVVWEGPIPGHGLALLLDGPDSARRAVPDGMARDLPGRLVAVAALPGETSTDFLVLRDAGGERLYFSRALRVPGAKLHLRPLDEPSLDAALFSGGELHDLDAVPDAEGAARGLCGPLALGHAVDAPLAAVVLVPAEEGAADIREALVLESGLWSYDGARQRRHLARTGQPVQGRQDFPDYFCPCPALAVGSPRDLARAKELILAGQAQGFVIDEPDPLLRGLMDRMAPGGEGAS